MRYVNCGAIYIRDDGEVRAGQRVATKKALKEAIERGVTIAFDVTSPYDPERVFNSKQLPEGIVLSVVGPHPEKARNWYASVQQVAGQVKVT